MTRFDLPFDFEGAGTRSGADRAALLAPGAGSDRNSAALVAVARALAAARVPSLRFDFPYRAAGRTSPDRPAVLLAAARAAASELARRTRLPISRVVVGGRSMGGRYCSLLAGDVDDPVPVLGLALLGYPLHPAGRPERRRDEHFGRIDAPVLFVSGTRDALGSVAELRRAAKRLRGPATFHWLETADHGFRPLTSSGRSTEELLAEAADVVVSWTRALP